MLKSSLVLALLALVAVDLPVSLRTEALHLKEERLIIEYTVTAGEAALVMSAESEVPLGRVELRDSEGHTALRLQAGDGRDLSLSGFNVESRESTLADLLESYPAGIYSFAGSTAAGHVIAGEALLSHELPRPVLITWPLDGSVAVPTGDLTVTWRGDTAAKGYQVILEQNENDGLTVFLPGESTSLRIPEGVLAARTTTLLEIATLAENGNRTIVELHFTTQ